MIYSPQDIKKILSSHPLFSSCEEKLLEALSYCDVRDLIAGEKMAQKTLKGQEEYYLILKGEMEVRLESSGDIYRLDQLKEGSLFGERNAKAFVEAKTPTFLLIISKEFIWHLTQDNPEMALKFLEKLHARTLTYLEKINQTTLLLIKQKKNMGLFLIHLTVFMSLFSLAVPFLSKLIKTVEPTFVSGPLFFLGAIFLLFRLLAAHVPLSTIGLHTHNLSRALKQALFLSVVIVGAWVLVKYLLIHFVPQWHDKPLFNAYASRMATRYHLSISTGHVFLFALVYMTYAFFQELLIRGGIQGMFKQFFSGNWRNVPATVLASLVFACAHAYFGIATVLTVFFSGLIWGWLYAKQGTLFGAAFAHMLSGMVILTFIGPL